MSPSPLLRSTQIFLLALSVLVLEVSLTRVFSFIMFHHMTYLVISVALLGFGAAGSALTARGVPPAERQAEYVSRHAAHFSLATLVAILVIPRVMFYPEDMLMRGDWSQIFAMFVVVLLAGAPFYFAGLGIGTIVSGAGEGINRVYFADLIGAALGSLVSIGLLVVLGGTAACFGVAALAMLVAALGTRERRGRYAAAFVVLLAVTIVDGLTEAIPIYAPPDKPLFRQQNQIEYTTWHPITRLDVTQELVRHHSFGGALSPSYDGSPPPRRIIYQDGGALTGIIRPTGSPETTPVLGHYMQGAAYLLRRNARSLVIGCGGGVDVMIALHHRARHVVGVDINPKTIDMLHGRYAEFAGGTFQRDDVELVASEGRHFLSRDDRSFDVIQLSGVDTYTALASGAYALTEYFVYTREAMDEYLDHLNPDGIVGFSRPILSPPRETAKLVLTALEALEARGAERAAEHLIVIFGQGKGTNFAVPWGQVMVKKSPYTPGEVERLVGWARSRDFKVAWAPFVPVGTNELAPFVTARGEERARMLAEYVYDLTPATDDRPFFFQYYRWGHFWKMKWVFGEGPQVTLAALIAILSFLQVTLLSALFILLPLRRRGGTGSAAAAGPDGAAGGSALAGRARLFVYFAGLGLGFIMVEIALLQKTTVFLGGPAYSMAITLFAVLLSTGLGSLASKSLGSSATRTIAWVVPVLFVVVILESLFLDHWMALWTSHSRVGRAIAVVAALFPMAFLMGVPFPAGLRYLNRVRPELNPWAWGINACATVVGSVATMMVSTSLGFGRAMQFGAGFYLVAWLALLALGVGKTREAAADSRLERA